MSTEPAVGQVWADNDKRMEGRTLHWSKWRTISKAWRTAAFNAATIARLPKGLSRVRIDVVLRFRDRRTRDTENYATTIKPIIDGLGPQRVYASKTAGTVVELGYGLIPGDDERYLVKPEAKIGPPLSKTAKRLTGLPAGLDATPDHPADHQPMPLRGMRPADPTQRPAPSHRRLRETHEEDTMTFDLQAARDELAARRQVLHLTINSTTVGEVLNRLEGALDEIERLMGPADRDDTRGIAEDFFAESRYETAA